MTPWVSCRFPAEAGRDRDRVLPAAGQRLTPPGSPPLKKLFDSHISEAPKSRLRTRHLSRPVCWNKHIGGPIRGIEKTRLFSALEWLLPRCVNTKARTGKREMAAPRKCVALTTTAASAFPGRR